jgi:hypothetical protein
MSGSSDNPENKKKLVFLFALIGIILIAFGTIVFIANYIGLPDGLSIPFIGSQNSSATTHDLIYTNFSSENGIVLTSMMKSADLVVAASGGSKWTVSNPGWYLYNARADFVDSQGLAQHWTLAFRADTSVLVAVINNGEVSSITVQDISLSPDVTANGTDNDMPGEVVEQYPEYNDSATPSSRPAGQNIFDTGNAMRLALLETGINMPQTSMPFSITYEYNGEQAAYMITYTDTVTPSRSFVVQLDAVTGHIMRSDRGVSK